MRLLLKILFPVLILAIGGGIAFWFVTHPKEAKKGGHGQTPVQLVELAIVETGSYHAMIEAMGQVGVMPEAIQFAGAVLSALLVCGIGGALVSMVFGSLGGRIYFRLR